MSGRRSWMLVPVLLASFSGQARALPWEWGVKAGLNAASFHGGFADVADPKIKLGFVGGGFAYAHVAPMLAIGGEVLYTMKGAKSESEQTNNQGNPVGKVAGFWQFDYVEVPILLRLSPHLGAIRPEFIGGPTVAFKVRGKFEQEGLGNIDLPDLKSTDLGFTAGIGTHLHLWDHSLVVEGRYGSGFSDAYDLEGNLETINHGYALTVGLVL